MSGRTSWWSRDAAHHDRELVVELGEEFGPLGPNVDTVLRDLAQQQKHSGTVRTGFRSLARKTFGTVDEVRAVVEHGAEIGLFDDLEIEPDGRRFTLRLSGWDADSETGTEAIRKRVQRAVREERKKASPTEAGHVPSERDESRSVPLTRPDQTTKSPLSPQGGKDKSDDDLRGAEMPRRPGTGRKRDEKAYEEQLERWQAANRDLLTLPDGTVIDEAAFGWITERFLRPDEPPTPENIVMGYQRWFPDTEAAVA